MTKQIVIIGGVAGGASAAARARRLSEDAKIILIERGAYVSFANCGLPYHIGGEIENREKLLIQTPESLHKRFNIEVRINTEAISINPNEKSILVKNIDGEEETIAYDDLILSTGANPIKPPISGINAKGVFTLRDISDMDSIISFINDTNVSSAIVIGGGYIGVEVAEQLSSKIKKVTLVEGAKQIMAPLDPEIALVVEKELAKHISLSVGKFFSAIKLNEETGSATGIILDDKSEIEGELVILGLGVRPESKLAKEAGLEIGKTGGVVVNDHLQTSNPNIWAVGDVIEVTNFTTQKPALISLAGPANRQGRMVADNILLNTEKKSYQGTLGTSVIRVFSKVAACTGSNEKQLKKEEIKYTPLYLFPGSHAGYFPGAKQILIKVLFNSDSRKLLGAQAIGEDGVDKRIDVFATAIKGGLTIDEIAELELCYAPPIGSAKDPVNMAGMMMQNVADNLVNTISPEDIIKNNYDGVLLDVRSDIEIANSAVIKDAINSPLDSLRQNLTTLPKNRSIYVYCQSGLRSYNATRILMQNGFNAYNITGAYLALSLFKELEDRIDP